ncbi:MAG: Endonuclease/exonuclease/phosphatase [Actinomycetia bacterium]|nr:Endonuclease/exonuclease/phosphatase [Actinomycetes bacterium]
MGSTRVATFNVKHGEVPGGDVDIGLLARSCAALDADVLALQEVDRGLRRSHDADTAAVVAEACGMTHVFGAAIAIRGGEYGNALLVRGSIDDVEVVALEDPEPRSAIVARIEVGGVGISVAATHLGRRGAGATQLSILLDHLAGRPGPRLLLGDLNLDPEDVDPLALGYDRPSGGPTFPAHAPRREIDHVLLDGLVATAAVVAPLPVSDHRALVVELDPVRSR